MPLAVLTDEDVRPARVTVPPMRRYQGEPIPWPTDPDDYDES